MQSFRERSGGYHGNQPCYQQEPHELSRLESYRQHPHHPNPQHPHPDPGHARGYEAHALANATSVPPAGGPGAVGGPPKDCYGQQAYPGYLGSSGGNGGASGGSAAPQAKKPYRGGKVPPPPAPSQHMQGPGVYGNPMGPGGYSAQYMNEGHLQPKWEEPAQLAQYEQELVGRIEPGGVPPPPVSSQYMDQSMLGHSQGQCQQATTPAYASPHHQPNAAPSPLMYPQNHLHYPQHSASPSPYMDKCGPMSHCYKGYAMQPSPQYGRQMGSHSMKQAGYRPSQNSYGYQQAPSRGYEPQAALQTMANPQHYSQQQQQQSYCLSELSVRSPEQYYQTCSPSSSHSPARSVGRSPSYSSTPSPLMTNPESFQYGGQPPMTPGAASSSSSSTSSSAGMQEQASAAAAMLMPPRSHPSPSVPHSYTSASQGPTMKERFSEKLLSNPSLWSLNALTSQVENISNNVQQLLLSEALVANKKGSKRSSGGSNSSTGSVGSSKKGEDYKSPPYPDTGGVSGGAMHDPYSTPQHQAMPMELHEGGYSSSSDEQLERSYYYCGQSTCTTQAPNNTHLSLDTASSCSMTSPDDMSTRSGDSGLHNLTPDPRSQSGSGGDGMSTPIKSIGDERSPSSVTVPSPTKQERDSPPDIQPICEPVKENFEESAWTEKTPEEEEIAMKKTPEQENDSVPVNSPEKLEKWSEDEKSPILYSKTNREANDKSFCFDTVYQEDQSKYDPDARDSVEQSPAALSDSSHKGHIGQEMKLEAFKSESPTASESSLKTSPFVSRGDLEQDQYSSEKEDSSVNTSPAQHSEGMDEVSSEKRESREDEEDEDEPDELEEEEEIQQQQYSLTSSPSAEVVEEAEEEETVNQSVVTDMNNTEGQKIPSVDLYSREQSQDMELYSRAESQDMELYSRAKSQDMELCSRAKSQDTELYSRAKSQDMELYSRAESQDMELHTETELLRTVSQTDTTIATAADVSEIGSAIGDMPHQPESAMPVFSLLNDSTTPQAQPRDHIDHSDAKVLEPDSPQLPGKSILPSAPSWANTPPSPKKGDEDMEPGISCASAVTPSAKPEPVAPSAQPRAFGRKHARGRRRLVHSGAGIRRQLSLEREGEKEKEVPSSPPQKICIPQSKTVIFTDQIDLAPQESILNQTPKLLTESFHARMCTRSFNAPDLPSKVEPHVKRKPGPKPGSKAGPKPGPKHGPKPSPKTGSKSGPKSGLKPGSKPGPKPGPKLGIKSDQNVADISLKLEPTLKRKPGPKPGSKPGSKPGPKPVLNPDPKLGLKPVENVADVLPPSDSATPKAQVGRPKGSITKAKFIQNEDIIQPLTGLQAKGKKVLKTTMSQVNQDETVEFNQEENEENTELSVKAGKNMILRSRKPSQDKLAKEKEKVLEEEIQTPAEMKAGDVSIHFEKHTSIEENLTVLPDNDKNIDVSIVLPAPATQQENKMILSLKRKPCPESSSSATKKKRGPKPKTKSLKDETSQLEEAAPKLKEKGVRAPKRKRGPPKKAPLSTQQSKETPPSVAESDVTTDVPAVIPQCPTKTKVLPPRKGRGQKYEAMVQKITSPSSKKHIATPQVESTPSDDTISKALSPHVLKESETCTPANTFKMIAGEVKSTEATQEGMRREEEDLTEEEVTEVQKTQEVRQEEPTAEGIRQDVGEESLTREEARQENTQLEGGRQEETTDSKIHRETAGSVDWSSMGSLAEVGAQTEWMHRVSAGIPDTAGQPAKHARTKRKRWAMVESTDASVVALEAGSLIVTTPRLAKQRAIKNNHEMHLKQKRKKRKGQVTAEEQEAAEESTVETAEQQQQQQQQQQPQQQQPQQPQQQEEEVETMLFPTETYAPLPVASDTLVEAPEVAAPEPVQKPRRGRKPSANPTKRKRGKPPGEQTPGKPVKVHKKPGPKPGMKDAMEVIEAVVRAAESEQTEKEEREKEERERREREMQEQPTSAVGPVVTVSEKLTETISLKRIRRKPPQKDNRLSFRPYVHMNSSRDIPSWCTIVNRPDEAGLLQHRKKSLAKMKNPITVAKAAPHALAMLKGPLVNKTLIDRCLTCCLCGKPANYRDLGDLCGPYYAEDSIPRKLLSAQHTEFFRDVRETAGEGVSDAGVEPTAVEPASDAVPKAEVVEDDGEQEGHSTETSAQEGSSGGNHRWCHRRAERAARASRERPSRRITLRERFRRMRQLQAKMSHTTGSPSDQEDRGDTFQRLRGEAEAKEHWAHDNCAIWTQGVIMVAGRLYGLKEATSTSSQTDCYKCQKAGASLSCCGRGCAHKYHYICAKETGCTFHEDDFSLKCPKHEDQ